MDWRTLNDKLAYMGEDEVLGLLRLELVGKRRFRFAERLHQRYTSLRTQRERVELINQLKEKSC